MKVHYLEIVSLDVDAVCKAYGATHNVTFGEADPLLGGARTCTLPDGSIIGVRAPLRDTENPVVRPYWLVEGIEEAVTTVEAQGAEIAVPQMEIPGSSGHAICPQSCFRQSWSVALVPPAGNSSKGLCRELLSSRPSIP